MSSMKGSFIITGCNGGLGKAVVADFLQSSNTSSYKGQFAVRNPSTATSLQAVLAASSSAKDHEVITMDLSNLSSVRKAAKEINDRVKSGEILPIRALLLNAALQHVSGQTYTDDGLESNFAVNYLANFLLALLLLPSMDKEAGRIVFLHISSTELTCDCRLSLTPHDHVCQRCEFLAVIIHADFTINEALHLIYILVVYCS